MEWATYVAEGIFFLIGLPLFAFQSYEILLALIEFMADYSRK